MDHILFSLVLLILSPVENAPPKVEELSVVDTFVRAPDCHRAREEHISRLDNGQLPPGVYVECVEFPHKMIW